MILGRLRPQLAECCCPAFEHITSASFLLSSAYNVIPTAALGLTWERVRTPTLSLTPFLSSDEMFFFLRDVEGLACFDVPSLGFINVLEGLGPLFITVGMGHITTGWHTSETEHKEIHTTVPNAKLNAVF
jgi:hypothetical protein